MSDTSHKAAEVVNGRFTVLGTLGSGAQGETLLAEDSTSGNRVALKRFFVRGASSWKDVELAEREALVQQQLAHPNLPRYVTHFEHAGALCLVTECIEGESLQQVLRRGHTLDQERVRRFLADAASALSYLHGLVPPLIHRDIKPANVLCRTDGSFAIVDFGSVQHRLRESGGSTVAGTFGFMAPEQLQGRAGPESDVYAAAATAVTALTGQQPEDLPHRGLGLDLARALPTCDVRLRRALEAMLEPNPELRPKSIQSALEAADLALVGGAVLARRSRWSRRLLIGSAALACLGGIGYGVQRSRKLRATQAALARSERWASAERAWLSGDAVEAGHAYLAARRDDPSHPVSLREAQAVSLADTKQAARVVRGLKQTWFQGPSGPAQAALDCLATRLEQGLPMNRDEPPLCVMPPLDRRQVPLRESSHKNPAYALHDPAGYVRFWPIYELGGSHDYWGTETLSLSPIVLANGNADCGVRRALFAAMAGDVGLLDVELRAIDALLDLLKDLLARRAHGVPETPDPRDAFPRPRSAAEIAEERETARFDAERVLSVAAIAAWFGHDETRTNAYLPYAEAHSRGIFQEHLDMVAGRQEADPHPAESPGDYTQIDMQIFASLRQDDPSVTLQKMRRAGYSEPARLSAMFGSGRYAAARQALATWVKAGFVEPTPTGGLLDLFERSFRRREAARLIGDTTLEAKLLVVTQKLGRILYDPRSYAAVVSLESVVAKDT